MKLSAVKRGKGEELCIWTPYGLLRLKNLNRRFDTNWPTGMLELIQSGKLDEMNRWYLSTGEDELKDFDLIPAGKAKYAPCFREPGKIWGIGLNYREHAADLSETSPETEPASFMKPSTSIIGHGDIIEIPLQSDRTTAEAELGIIIGRECRNITRDKWKDYVAGFTPVLDMTAEDILRKNPRYLTRAKSFDTFFSFGPQFLTTDEIEDIMNIRVSTVINGQVLASNTISNMVFPPDFLVSFHSEVMTLLPGDIISSGTPGAAVIRDGDLAECRIERFEPLANPVNDLKI